MDFMRDVLKKTNRARWGKGLCVLTRDPRNGNRLKLLSFATTDAASDFARRARLNGIRVVAVR